jgi:hypothetical protein
MKKIGRPKKTQRERLSNIVNIRFTETQYKDVKKKAIENKSTVSGYIRQMARARLVALGFLLFLFCGIAVAQTKITGVTTGTGVTTISDNNAVQASPATCTPTSGNVPQTVTCTNPNSGTTIACYTEDGSTPATNFLGTACAHGTAYTTALTISSALTLKIIAGALGYVDSIVNSYTYTAVTGISQSFNGIDPNQLPLQGGSPFSIPSGGIGRMWDSTCASNNAQWVSTETSNAAGNANTAFNWTCLDNYSAAFFTAGYPYMIYTLTRTPQWAAQNNTGSTQCKDYNIPSGNTNQCMPPTDLNADGTGTNLIWRNWVAGVAAHANAPGYQSSHSYIKYWEMCNECEGNANAFWEGSFDQQIRMTEDAKCILNLSSGSVAKNSGETCLHVRQQVDYGAGSTHVVNTTLFPNFPTNPIDPNAIVVMTSFHANTGSLPLLDAQAYLYGTGTQCNNTPPCGFLFCSCHSATGTASASVDMINFHMKPGNNYNSGTPSGEMETVLSGWYTNIQGILSVGDQAKSLFGTEGGYNGTNAWAAPYVTTDTAGLGGSCALQAGFVARYWMYNYALGINPNIWYNWKQNNYELACSDFSPNAVSAAQQVNNWMVNSTGFSCSPIHPTSGALFTCPFTTPQGNAAVAVWYLCSAFSAGSPCSSYQATSRTISSFFGSCSSSVHQVDLAGNITVPASGCGTTVSIGNGSAAWGPLLFMNQSTEP